MLRLTNLLLFLTLTGSCLSQAWESGVLYTTNGEEKVGELKWRKNLSVPIVKWKGTGAKQSIELAAIDSIDSSSGSYKALTLSHLEGNPISLARKVSPGLFYGYFKEIRCLCDNSFNTVEAYFVRLDGRWAVLRKKAIGDQLKMDEDASLVLGAETDQQNFSTLPEILEIEANSP